MNGIKETSYFKAKYSVNKSNTINDSKKKSCKTKKFFSKNIYKTKKDTDKENSITFLNKKTLRFQVEKNELNNKRKIQENKIINEGRWTKEEHDKFLDGIVQYGTD